MCKEKRALFINNLLEQLSREIPFLEMKIDFPYLYESELTLIFPYKKNTLAKFRNAGTDCFIPWHKLGGRVIYKTKDVIDYYYSNF